MKIAWFTPFARKSAIGQYSRAVTDQLANDHEVHIWAPKTDEYLQTGIPLFKFGADGEVARRMQEYDLSVYNIGDHFGYHHEIYEISKMHQGVIVLHDYIMHHFFHYYYLQQNDDPASYVHEMELLYGSGGKKIALDLIRGVEVPGWEFRIMDFPFYEKAIAGSLGVVCHSAYLAETVSSKSICPVCAARIPLSKDILNSSHIPFNRNLFSIPTDKAILLTMGNVNPNKRIDLVIECLGASDKLRNNFVYVIIGSCEDALLQKYKSIVNGLNLRGAVHFLGYQTDEVLHGVMKAADIFINLRKPVMEGGSASLVEQLSCGKPIIVSKAGHYAELPDDCVVKIDTANEKESLTNALCNFADHSELKPLIGSKGKEYQVINHNVSKYCETFNEFITVVRQHKPMLSLIDKAALELSSMRVSRDLSVVGSVTAEIFNIFADR